MYKPTASTESVPHEPIVPIVHGHLFHSCCVSLFGCSNITEVRSASLLDKTLMIVGLVSAVITGMCLPLIVIMFSKMMDMFIQYELHRIKDNPEMFKDSRIALDDMIGYRWISPDFEGREDYSLDALIQETRHYSLDITVIATIQLVAGAIFVKALNYTAHKYTLKIRVAYVKALLHNELAWFDAQDKAKLCASTNTLINAVHDGRGEKLGFLIYTVSSAVSCFVAAFSYGWQLALIVTPVLAVVMVIAFLGQKASTYLLAYKKKCYAEAEAVAAEALINIRSVALYRGEKIESALFGRSLNKSVRAGIYVGSSEGFFRCLLWFTLYCSYALSFYYGVTFAVVDLQDHYSPPLLIIIFFCAQIGVVNFLQLPGLFAVLFRARRAAKEVQDMTHRKPQFDHGQTEKSVVNNICGFLTFNEVSFAYPSNPDVYALKGMHFEIVENQTVVFVGATNSGKSTIMRLVHRLYDPDQGNIRIDGMNVRKMSVAFLRRRVGYVQQHPVLFGATIIDAIRCNTPNVSLNDVIEVARVTACHEAIGNMTRKYDTPMTADLSDDIKQRIAISRVLLRRPHILVLDNASSCMSAISEDKLHRAIRAHGTHKTLLIVSSRVQAMSMADKVFHIVDGAVAEEGTFVKLMETKGRLYKIIKRSLLLKRGRDNRMEDDSIDEFESIPSKRLNQLRDLSTFNRPPRGDDHNADLVRSATVHASRFPVFPNIVDIDNLDNFTYAIDEMKEFTWRSFLRLNAPEWPFLFTACVASVLTGCCLPAYAVLFGECLGVIAMHSSNADYKEKVYFFTQLFVMAGFISGIAQIVQGYMVAVAGAKLTKRLRKKVFEAMLRQELAWFDEENNSVDSLLQLIREDAHNARHASGPRLTSLVQHVSTLVVCGALSFHYSWQLGVTILLFVPLMLYGLVRHTNMMMEQVFCEGIELQKARAIVEEAVMNITTVMSLTMEATFLRQYALELSRVHRKLQRLIRARGFMFGFALAIPCYAYAVCIWFGGHLIHKNDIGFDTMFKVTEVLMLGTLMVGQIVNFSPDSVNARIAASRILKVINRTPLIYSSGTEFQAKWKTNGNIKFRRIGFNHRTRSGLPSLSMFNVMMEPGKMVALVGPLGCGKSVPIQLLCRFYNPTAGVILMDGRDIASSNLCSIRAQIGLADGDPVFFRRTVAENIAYGMNYHSVSMDEVVCAAKEANIHNWISSLDEGYHTVLGADEPSMTNSQKLRLSLARALIRDPPILLIENLLESESEEASMLVEEALKRACIGRSVMIVLRHLKTVVRHSDHIFVLRNGAIVEDGTHEALIEKRGVYYRLYCRQELLHRRTESALIHQTIVREARDRAASAENRPPNPSPPDLATSQPGNQARPNDNEDPKRR